MRVIAILVLLLQWLTKPIFGDNLTEIERSALNNFSHEMIICSAYYTIAAEGMRRTGDNASAEKLTQVADVLVQRSLEINESATVLARLDLALQDHIKAINQNFENISVLILRYGEQCKSATEHPEQRIEYWRGRLGLVR